MAKIKLICKQWSKQILLMLFFIGVLIPVFSQSKLQKDGKYKQKKHKVADHHERMVQKKKHHAVDWTHHNQAENKAFSKKKKMKLK